MTSRLRKAAALLMLLLSAGCQRAAPRPNVLLYVVDTLRADALGAYRSTFASTPNIDRFAQEGLLFERAYSASSWTRPALASILTGALPSRHRAEDRAEPFDSPHARLPELLREEGYRTGFITSNPNVGSFFGFARGFDDIIELYARREAGPVSSDEVITKSDIVSQKAIEWINDTERPFFLTVLSVDPHYPYSPPEAFLRAAHAIQQPLSPTDRYRALYRAEVSFNDASFGDLLEYLEVMGLRDNTVVVFVSDHGEEFWEHGNYQHGLSLFEEVLWVPLIFRYPGSDRLAAGTRVRSVVSTTDILPTLLDLLGIEAPAANDGQSLIDSNSRNNQTRYASLRLDRKRFDAVYEGPWKLIVNPETGEEWVYHIKRDPREKLPWQAPYSGSVQAARERLHRALEAMPRSQLPTSQEDRSAPPQEVQRALEALGYVE